MRTHSGPGLLPTAVTGAGPTFHTDVTFKGSPLTGWQILADAAWHVANGELVGAPKSEAGGWLYMDQRLHDPGLSGVVFEKANQWIVQPPSTIRTWPTTISDRWLDRNKTAPTRSSGWFQRPAGICCVVAHSL
jgi:hypothetical protein